jgi:hypothetical protein
METRSSPQCFSYRIKSLCRKVEEVDKEVHEMFFLIGQNIITEYRIIEQREREQEIRDDPEYLRDFMSPDTDPRALAKFKFYIEKFLRNRCASGFVDAQTFKDSLEGRYGSFRRTGLARLVDKLEKLRHEVGKDLEEFYQFVSPFVEKDGKIYDFGFLFNARGQSEEYLDFLSRVEFELTGRERCG